MTTGNVVEYMKSAILFNFKVFIGCFVLAICLALVIISYVAIFERKKPDRKNKQGDEK